VVLGLAAAAALGVVPAATAATATPTDAVISNFSFAPDPVTIPVGGSVKWTNDDNATHTVTADDGSFDSGFTSLHGTFTRTFTQAGTFAYHCNVHSSMQGTVKVEAATTTTTAAPTTTTTAAPTTTTTARATTTTVPSSTTQPPSTTTGAAGTTAPTSPGSVPPKAPSPKPTAPTTTRAPADPTTTGAPPAAPATTATAPASGSGETPTPAVSTPPTEVASGAPTPPNATGGGRGGTGPAVAALAALFLGGTAFGVFRYRRHS
jgi:plastocyanin